MNTTMLKGALMAVTAVGLMAGGAMATPVYTGETSANYSGNIPGPAGDFDAGYYVWSNDAAKTSWSVRWTGNGLTENQRWFGSIDFISNDLDTVTEIRWETPQDGDISVYQVPNVGEFIVFGEQVSDPQGALSGPGWDGFDFTLLPQNLGRVRFNLGGTYYSSLGEDNSVDGTVATALFVGESLSFPLVNIGTFDNGYVFQHFEVNAPVPEPATMLLFGTGLTALAGAARRRLKK